MVVYAPVFDTPSAIKAGKTIADSIYDMQLTAADARCVIAGDFNHCDLRKIIPSLKQCFVSNQEEQYHRPLLWKYTTRIQVIPYSTIGNSDHDTVKLVPLHRPKIRTA